MATGEAQVPDVFLSTDLASHLIPAIQHATDLLRQTWDTPPAFGTASVVAARTLAGRDAQARQGFDELEDQILQGLNRLAETMPRFIDDLVEADDSTARDIATLASDGRFP